jgi:hypothetical protein
MFQYHNVKYGVKPGGDVDYWSEPVKQWVGTGWTVGRHFPERVKAWETWRKLRLYEGK